MSVNTTPEDPDRETVPGSATANVVADDWDSEQAIDDSVYQGLVDRLHEKADKEVSRVVKVCTQSRVRIVLTPRLSNTRNVSQLHFHACSSTPLSVTKCFNMLWKIWAGAISI